MKIENSQLKKSGKSPGVTLSQLISEVIIIPLCLDGQLYTVQGLQSFPRFFSVGIKGNKILLNLYEDNQIKCVLVFQLKKHTSSSLYIKMSN